MEVIKKDKLGAAKALEMTSKKVETVPVKTNERINLGDIDPRYEPFVLIGEKGKYTLALGNCAVWEESLESKEKAMKILDEKPWNLILVTTKVYSEYVNEYAKRAKKIKK